MRFEELPLALKGIGDFIINVESTRIMHRDCYRLRVEFLGITTEQPKFISYEVHSHESLEDCMHIYQLLRGAVTHKLQQEMKDEQ